MKELMMEEQEQQEDKRLAKKLGITYDELLLLDHTIEPTQSDDGLIFGYIISFDHDAPKDILDKIKGLGNNNEVWLSTYDFDEDEYYEEQFDAIVSNKHYYDSFKNAIASARELNNLAFANENLEGILKRQIYSSIIGAIEAFLSETFINQTDESEGYFRNFIETFPDFKERKFELSEIYKEYGKIKETARKVILEIIYHNLAKVSNMYKSTFKIEFPNIADLSRCVSVRHDLVHRNGRTKEGEVIVINKEMVTDLIDKASNFVDDIAQKLNL